MKRTFVFVVWILMMGCQKEWQPHSVPWDALNTEAQRKRIVASAEEFSKSRVFSVESRIFSHDCSGYVAASLLRSGIDVYLGASELDIRGNGVLVLHQFITKYGSFNPQTAQPGDLVFFSNTFDRNHDGKLNDSLTHVGIIDTIDDDGTVYFLHYIRGQVSRYAMNLDSPGLHSNPEGKVINSYLRKKRRRDPKNTPYLTSTMFAGFGSLVQNPERLTSQKQSNSTVRAE